jgi:hypothetical protein
MAILREWQMLQALQLLSWCPPEPEQGQQEYGEEDAEADDGESILPVIHSDSSKHDRGVLGMLS